MGRSLPPHTTLTYKKIGDQPVQFDIYQPKSFESKPLGVGDGVLVPAVVYFHGGGLTVGSRESWFPHWLHRRTVDLGATLLCPDHQLLPPATGHDILSDVKEFLEFIVSENAVFEANTTHCQKITYRIDPSGIVLAGTSAGGLCAYLAAGNLKHLKLKGILSMYGMGGDFLTPYWMEIKHDIFIPGREMLDPKNFTQFLHPFSLSQTTISELQYYPDDHPTPGFPANPRMQLGRLYCQLGTYLDYYTGEHEPSLSEALRLRRRVVLTDRPLDGKTPPPEEWGGRLIPERHHVLFPQLSITSEWPEVYIIHGTDDHLVHLHESEHLKELLDKQNVNVTLRVVEGKGHSFDYALGAEDEFEQLFDEVGQFLSRVLKN